MTVREIEYCHYLFILYERNLYIISFIQKKKTSFINIGPVISKILNIRGQSICILTVVKQIQALKFSPYF